MNKLNRVAQALIQSPLVWGGLVCGAFYGAMNSFGPQGPLRQLFHDYFTAHPVNYAESAMFFVGIAALVVKAIHVVAQNRRLEEPLLGPRLSGDAAADCDSLLARLDRRAAAGEHYLVRRVREALEHVRRRGSAESLPDELKYLSDLDVARAQDSYSLVKVILWAIPILGFLGTVIGITMAVAKLEPEALEQSLPEVVAGLSVAFNTTAQGLTLTMILMFAYFFVERSETRLLSRVDDRAEEELLGRFELVADTPDGQLAAVRRMTETLVASSEQLVRRQAELWQASMEAAGQRWTAMSDAAETRLRSSLGGALAESLKAHARELAAVEQAAAEENRRHWDRVQQALVQHTEALSALEQGLVRQAETASRAVEASGQIARLEEALNRNLAALAGSGNFEQTVNSLAAAIHLLNGRLGQVPGERTRVQLDSAKRTGHAA